MILCHCAVVSDRDVTRAVADGATTVSNVLRTTGAGFCYNFGRILAAGGTVYFGLTAAGQVGDYAKTLYHAGFLFIPAALIALLLPEEREADGAVNLLAD